VQDTEAATAAPPRSPSRARAAFRRRVDGLPAPYWWLWLGTLINRAGTFIEPFAILYLTGPRHLSIATAGTVVTVWGAGSLVSQPIGGYLTDRIGRRTTLSLGMFAVAFALGLLALARGLPAIMLAALFLGVVGDIYRPASSAGLLVQLGFGVLFAVDAVTSLLFGLVVLRKVPETRPASAVRHEHEEPAWRLMLRDRMLLALVALFLCYATLYGQVYVTLPLAVRDAGLGTGSYGLIMAVNGIVIVIVQPLVLNLIARAPGTVLLPVTILLVGGGIALSGVCNSTWAFGLTVVVWTLGEIGQTTALMALVASIAPEALRGRYLGAVGLAWGASAMLAPFLGSRVYAANPAALWLGCLALAGVAAAGLYALATRLRRVPATA
jgi:MFS family permease